MNQEQNTPKTEMAFPPARPSGRLSAKMIAAGIAVLIILGTLGWYVSCKIDTQCTAFLTGTPGTPASDTINTSLEDEDAATAALLTQGTSDEISAIETDLNATDLSSLNEINQ